MAERDEQAYLDLRPPLTRSQALSEVGVTGLRRAGPYVREEYLPDLQGPKGVAKLREMYASDACRLAIRAIKLPMLEVDWRVEGGEGPDAERAQQFLASCLEDMSHTWRELLDEIITETAVYGASWFQVVYKRRMGPDRQDPGQRSAHRDGLWGWRKFSPRYRETWNGWVWQEDGGVAALIQLDPSTGTQAQIPLERSLHFTLEGRMGNPEGESLLRAAYPAYYGLRHADVWAGILIERMGGFPVFRATEREIRLWSSAEGMAELREYLQKAAVSFALDEQMGMVLPWGVEMQLLAPPIRLEDIISYINLCRWRILASVLGQFLELGRAPHGSYAKSESDKDLFLLSVEAMLRHRIAEVINRYEVPRLFAMNGGSFRRLSALPRLIPGDVRRPDLSELAEPLAKLAQAGLITAGPALETWLRQVGQLPEEGEAGEAVKGAGPGEAREALEEARDRWHWTLSDLS